MPHKKHKQSIFVYLVHHPIEKSRVTIVEVPYNHQTLAQLKHEFTNGQEVIIVLDEKEIPPHDWDCVKPLANSKVVIGPAVADPVTLYLFGATLAATLWYVAVHMAIAYGLAYLGGLLFGTDVQQPQAPTSRESGQSFAWTPQTTQQEGISKSMCYGRNMHYGNIVTRWTDVDVDGNEILYMILDYGGGPVKGKTGDVYFNDQSSSYYSGVSVQERLGTLNQSCMTGFEKNKLEYRPNAKITYEAEPGSFTWLTPNNFLDDLEYTLEFPRGIWHYRDDGSRESYDVGVKVEITERGLDDWTTLLDRTISGDQLAPVYKAYKVSDHWPSYNIAHDKQYELRCSKTSEDKDPGRWGNEFVLRAVREVVDIAFTRPGRALLGITALATAALNQRLNIKWVAEDKLVNIFNGTSWSIGFTRNRAWIYLDELTQPVISGDGNGGGAFTIEKYEGLNPDSIDLALIYEWALFCDEQVPSGIGEETENRITCDVIVDWQTDVWSLAYEIAQIGRMYPYWKGTILTGWFDDEIDEYLDLITFDNIMTRSWKNSWAGYGEMAGKVSVFFKDALVGYERKGLPLHNSQAGLYTKIVNVEGIGIISRSLATRVGNHILNRNKLIKNINSVRMYKSAMRYELGKVVRLQATIPDWGQTYRVIQSETNDTVELDRIITDVSPADLVFVRCYNEVLEKVSIDSYTVESIAGKVLTIVETWLPNVTPIKDNVLAIGVADKIKLRRIVKIQKAVDNYTTVEFETYNKDLFTSDQTQPQLPNPDYVKAAADAQIVNPITRWEIAELIEQLLPPTPDTDIPFTSNCKWNNNTPSSGYISWSKRDAAKPILYRYRGTTYEIAPGNTNDEWIYWVPGSPNVFSSTAIHTIALTAGNWVMCTNKAGIAFPVNPIMLMHAAVLQAGSITAAFGQIAELAVDTLQVAGLAITTPKIADYAVSREVAERAINAVSVKTTGTTVCGPLSLQVSDGDVKLTVTAFYGATPSDDEFWSFFRENGDPIEVSTCSVTALVAWPFWMCYVKEYRYTPGPGTYEYTVKGFSDDNKIIVANRFFTAQEMKK